MMATRTTDDFLLLKKLPSLKKMGSITKLPTVRRKLPSLRLVDVGPLGPPTRRNRNRRERQQDDSSSRNVVQDFVGQVIKCDTRPERPFCSSSVTMPDFNPEDSFIIYDDDDKDELANIIEEIAAATPPGMTRRISSDNQPSKPLRRTSTLSQTEVDTRPKAPSRSSSGDVVNPIAMAAKRDAPPSPPCRGRPSLVDSVDSTPSRPCRGRPSLIEL